MCPTLASMLPPPRWTAFSQIPSRLNSSSLSLHLVQYLVTAGGKQSVHSATFDFRFPEWISETEAHLVSMAVCPSAESILVCSCKCCIQSHREGSLSEGWKIAISLNLWQEVKIWFTVGSRNMSKLPHTIYPFIHSSPARNVSNRLWPGKCFLDSCM